ncbi:hypothetical protein ACQBAU_00165 [Propionibacteriaceae bacterium Y2011]|uniref:hypothetical protein n=1 Tax=Microlunatus sp. Y2014 TaxID=3418488 RepID=UPI003B486DF6
MTELKFDTRALRVGADELSTTADDLRSQFADTAASAPAWGEDDVSALCQMAYEAIVQVVTESIEGVGEGWGEHAELLQAAADLYDATEQQNVSLGSTMVGGE